MNELPVRFFTIVLDGMPFIQWHLHQFRRLPFRWKWHVVDGPALPEECTAWCKNNGGQVPHRYLVSGKSLDGTVKYLMYQNPREVSVDLVCCRIPKAWHGKLEMLQRLMMRVTEPCLLWQIDADELWTAEQIVAVHRMFLENPEKTAAKFRCHYFVGPDLVTTTLDTYGNHDWEWQRVWRFEPGDKWKSHEPPVLTRGGVDVATLNPFTHVHTAGLRFQHFAYATEPQLRFKEEYYGYRHAVDQWRKLQKFENFPVRLSEFFPWVTDETMVDRVDRLGINPLMEV